MFAHCLFCASALGANESIEHFPVGRRLAFDAAKGRLWVVCLKCQRWNLSPLEIRWEAIEECERAYRDTKLRMATEHIGLARLADGTELVRIGRPLLPEFAAWRYGDVFRSRRDKLGAVSIGASAVVGVTSGITAMSVGGQATMYTAGMVVVGAGVSWANFLNMMYQSRRVRTSVNNNAGERLLMSSWDASASTILRGRLPGDWVVDVEHRKVLQTGRLLRAVGIHTRHRQTGAVTTLRGDAAIRALSTLLPVVNRGGSSKKNISDAVSVVTDTPSVEQMIQARRTSSEPLVSGQIGRLPAPVRLALEMVAHEADERRALEGELHELEARWRDAEEIAAIADGLFISPAVDTRLTQLRDDPRIKDIER